MIRKGSWSPEECSRLAEIYPHFRNAEIAALMDRSLDAIESRAYEMGLKKSASTMVAIRQRSQKGKKVAENIVLDKPTVKPAVALKGVVYGVQKREPGVAVNGDRARRYVAHRA